MRRILCVLAVLIAVAAAAVIAYRWWPRPPIPPTAEMCLASNYLESHPPTAYPRPRPPQEPSTDRERLIAAAWEMLDTPYEWGAKGPDRYDCSGFTKAAYEAVGVKLPDGSFNQAAGEEPLRDITTLSPGDLLFYRWAGGERVSHVTMYIGDGWVIGTGSPGQPKKVVVYPLASDFSIAGTVVTARHVPLSDE